MTTPDPFSQFNADTLISVQAEDALNNGHCEEAISYYFNLLRNADKSQQSVYHSRIAQCRYRKREYKECIESARESLNQPDSQILLGLSLFKLDDVHSALLFIDNETRTAELSEFVTEELNKELPSIQQLAKEQPPTFPESLEEKANYYKQCGNFKFKSKDYKGAAVMYEKAVSEIASWREMVNGIEKYHQNKDVFVQCDKFHGILVSNLINSEIKQDKIAECIQRSKQLVKLRPDWKKSYYWYGTSLIADFRSHESRQQFNKCLACPNANSDEVKDRLEFVDFSDRHEKRIRSMPFTRRLEIFSIVKKNISWMSGNAFASSITKIYYDTDTSWNMTTSALVDTANGEIRDFMAPKYETSEKDRNLMNEVNRNEKTKIFIHLTQDKINGAQKIGFSNTDNLKSSLVETLEILKHEIDGLDNFNVFIKNYLK